MSRHLRIPAPLTLRGVPSWCRFLGGWEKEAEERNCLSMWTVCWMLASLGGGLAHRQKSASISPASVSIGLDIEEESVA